MLSGASFELAGCMLHGVMSTRGSNLAFFAAGALYTVYAAGLPTIAARLGAPPQALGSYTFSALIMVVMTLMVWRLSMRMTDAEEAALTEAERRRKQAEAATQAKSTFVAIVSHELRTPMTAILAGASALKSEASPSARSHGALIAEAGGMMRTLLNDLLDMSKIEAGKLTVETIPFDARALVLQALQFWRAEAQRKGLRLSVRGVRHQRNQVHRSGRRHAYPQGWGWRSPVLHGRR